MEAEMKSNIFLRQNVITNDLILVRVISSPKPQVLFGKIEKSYSKSHGTPEAGNHVEFTHAPSSWGRKPLKVGNRALVFISKISNRFYECASNGHMLIESIEGRPYAIYHFKEIWNDIAVPDVIRSNAIQDPIRPYCSAIYLPEIEQYLSKLIEQVNKE